MCLRRSQCVFIFSNQPIEPVDLISRRKKKTKLYQDIEKSPSLKECFLSQL